MNRLENYKIVVCDDSKTNLAIAQSLLAHGGFMNIRTTDDPRQLKGIMTEFGCDVLMLDLEMPHLSGFDIINQIRQDDGDKDVQILMLTGKQGVETRNKALELGANDFVNKPFDPTEVMLRVKNLLKVRQGQLIQKRMNRILEETVKKRTEQLNQAADDLLATLGRAGEYRDNDTGEHVNRVSAYSFLLAEASGLSPAKVQMISKSAAMHDIGKIGISDTILLKNGPLTDEERAHINRHCEIGAEILSGHTTDIVLMGQSIAQNHHEKWDGSGYPCGLCGEDIPIEGRIVSIADVFDALTTKRPYKEPWPLQKAYDLLERESGKAFDPKLVDLFLNNKVEVERIYNQYQ